MIARHDIRPGGQVATTLAACARFGLATRYIGAFGNDDHGTRIRRALEDRGIDVQSAVVRTAANRYAVILIDATHGERVVLWERDAALAFRPDDVCTEWLAGAALLHVDATDEAAATRLARLGRDRGLPVTCDVDRVTGATSELLDAVTVPILAEHVPQDITHEADPERALRLLRRPPTGRIVLTLGARGSAMLDGDRFIHVPGFDVSVVDTTGAGDVFRGAFIYSLLRGDRPAQMLRFANAAAALSCTREGAIEGIPTLEEVERFLARGV